MMTAELIEAYNGLNPPRPITSWKRCRDELATRVEGWRCPPDRRGGLNNAEVAERVRECLPGTRTSPRLVAWHAAMMRRRGVEAPKRGRSR